MLTSSNTPMYTQYSMDAPSSEKVQIEIPYGVVEYTALFKKPILEAWSTNARTIASVLEALTPFGFKLDGVEAKTHTEKLSEYAIVFKRLTPNITLTLNLWRLVIVAENLDWKEAEEFLKVAHAGLSTVVEKTAAQIEAQKVGMGLHIQLKNRPRREVTAPLLTDKAYQLMDGDVQAPGIILQLEKSSILIDASAAFANGLFVRINRDHAADVTLEEIAEILHGDEKKICDVLNLESDL